MLRRRSGSLPPGRVMLVSDEAPEATCLSNLCGSFRRLVRRLFPLHASLWQGGDGRRDRSPTFDRARVRLGRVLLADCLSKPGRWPGRFPPDGAPIRPGPSPGGWGLRSFATSASSPPFFVAPPSGDVRDGVGALSVCLSGTSFRSGYPAPGHPTPSPSLPAPRPEGDRCSGPGICACESTPPRRRPRLA